MTHPRKLQKIIFIWKAESVGLKYIVTYSRMNLINKREGKLENSLISTFIFLFFGTHKHSKRHDETETCLLVNIQFHYYASYRKLIILI